MNAIANDPCRGPVPILQDGKPIPELVGRA